MTDLRAAWVATCVFWAWSWAVGAIMLTVFTFGVSLLMLIPAGLSVWAVMIPVGKPPEGNVPLMPARYMGQPPVQWGPPTQRG